MGNVRRKRERGRLLPCSAGPVAPIWFREPGFSLIPVWSDSDRQRTPAPSPEADMSASVEGMAGRREGAGSELWKSFG